MKVTYLICNRNYGHYIKESIKSAQDQTYPCHICIIDDGSTDDSIEKIFECVTHDNTKLFHGAQKETDDYKLLRNDKYTLIQLNKNRGPSFARNIGILETKDHTDIYAILDADDYNYKTKIEECIVPFEDPNVGVVYADYDIYNCTTQNLIREYKPPYDFIGLRKDNMVHSGALIRKTILDKVVEPSGWYDVNLTTAEDFDLWLRISEVAMIHHIPKSLSFVRSHNNSSVNYRSKEEWEKNWQRVAYKTQLRNEGRNIPKK